LALLKDIRLGWIGLICKHQNRLANTLAYYGH
jgi:hypothetical protein